MYTKVLIPFALVALTLSTHANPIAIRRSNSKAISATLEKRAESGDGSTAAAAGDAASTNPLESMLGALDPISAASELISDTGSALESGASGMASLMGIAPTSNNASATGAENGDLPANPPSKRYNFKREPLGLEDLTGAIGGAGGKGKADAATAGGNEAAGAAANPLSGLTGLLGGAGAGGAGGAAGGDLLANLPIKRDSLKR